MADSDALAGHVGALEDDADYVQDCWDQSVALVDQRAGSDTVPDLILQRAYVEVGADLYWRRGVRNGIVGLQGDGSPMRISRDPMMTAESILRPFLSPGFA